MYTYMYIYPYAVWPHYEPKASLEGKATPWPIFKLASFGLPGGGLKTIGMSYVLSMTFCCGSFGI